MSIPKESRVNLPIYPVYESQRHSVQFARELIGAMQGKDILLQQGVTTALPDDSVGKNLSIKSCAHMEFPVGKIVLDNIVAGPYEQPFDKVIIEQTFDLQLQNHPEHSVFSISVGTQRFDCSTAQTYMNFSEPFRQRMLYGIIACLSDQDTEVCNLIRSHGILITTGESAHGTALWVPERILTATQMPRFRWQREYAETSVLFPIDILSESYEAYDSGGHEHVRVAVEQLLQSINPLSVKVFDDTIAYIKHVGN